MSIKYYQLAKDEELPDEFCAVRDVGGEPSEYTFYVPEADNAKLREDNDRLIQAVEDLHDVKLEDKLVQLENKNDKLRELVRFLVYATHPLDRAMLIANAAEMGIEVDE